MLLTTTIIANTNLKKKNYGKRKKILKINIQNKLRKKKKK